MIANVLDLKKIGEAAEKIDGCSVAVVADGLRISLRCALGPQVVQGSAIITWDTLDSLNDPAGAVLEMLRDAKRSINDLDMETAAVDYARSLAVTGMNVDALAFLRDRARFIADTMDIHVGYARTMGKIGQPGAVQIDLDCMLSLATIADDLTSGLRALASSLEATPRFGSE